MPDPYTTIDCDSCGTIVDLQPLFDSQSVRWPKGEGIIFLCGKCGYRMAQVFSCPKCEMNNMTDITAPNGVPDKCGFCGKVTVNSKTYRLPMA